MQKIWDKLTVGLKDYCYDNGFSDIILGLSGGLDSAICAVLAADALGSDHVHAWMMKTQHTSELSLKIAHEISKINHLDYQEIDIQPVIDNQKAFLQTVFKTEPKNIVIENLQARERGKILMAASNQFGYLLLACGNKSELAMGYCTLYGDTCGGLAPIGGLYKSEIFELAKWRNNLSKVLPPEVISRAPSAELSANQKDEDSLPPYALLDKILRFYLDEKFSPAEIVAEGYDAVIVEWIVKRYHSQGFKRQQTAQALSI